MDFVTPLYPQKDIRYPLYRRLGGPQGRSGKVHKISPPPWFEPWTVWPVFRRYTDCVLRAHNCLCSDELISLLSKRNFTSMWIDVLTRYSSECYCFCYFLTGITTMDCTWSAERGNRKCLPHSVSRWFCWSRLPFRSWIWKWTTGNNRTFLSWRC
jgi:hypothetical protein